LGRRRKAQWLASQRKRRSYADDVLGAVDDLRARFDVVHYGQLDYGSEAFPLFAIRPCEWRDDLPCALVTGGVHGYETSGVHGALQFAQRHLADYAGRINVLIVPCVSPWAYERIHRWNPLAIDPNRSFRADSPESAALTKLVAPLRDRFVVHVDLHETTDSDESEFRPALAARDGKPFEAGEIPDGFYLVDDTEHPQPAFQQAVIDAVEKVTHIAPADARAKSSARSSSRPASSATHCASSACVPASRGRSTRRRPRCIPTVRARRRSNATTHRPPPCARRSTM
jgi:hypothetical protein